MVDIKKFKKKPKEEERPAESLDEILAEEGIDISDGDVNGNVIGMYQAGFSIIEISKVMKLGVSDVKYIIDHQSK